MTGGSLEGEVTHPYDTGTQERGTERGPEDAECAGKSDNERACAHCEGAHKQAPRR